LTKFNTLSAKEKEKYHDSGGGFYDWYAEQQRSHKKRPEDLETQSVSAITYLSNEAMFDVNAISSGTQYKQLVVLNRDNIQKKRIVEIMTKEDFIFIDASPSDESIMKSLSSGKSSLSSSSSSPLYGVGVETPEQQAGIIAKEVYGVDVSSFKELHTMHKKSKRKKSGSSRRNSDE
jgi:mRNA-degrading endonuclease HigB of HigAB toxin-antitoxin module